jgi:hypothetical protein
MDKSPNESIRLPQAPEAIPAGDPRVTEVTKQIEAYHRQIPLGLRSLPDAQERCLQYLFEAEQAMTPPVVRPQLIQSRLLLTRIHSELARATMTQTAFVLIATVLYACAGVLAVLFHLGAVGGAPTAEELNKQLFLGVPRPVLLWALIGTFTSMLLRCLHSPFADRTEALRWMLFRPVVGVVMGVVMYLMVIAGLLVLAGTREARTPELLWIIAFVGSFSDTLSINPLQRLLGRFRPVDWSVRRRPAEDVAGVVGVVGPRPGQRDGGARVT